MIVFYDPNLPEVGKGTGKMAKVTRIITGSSAAGKALPPHLQFMTAVTAEEREHISHDLVAWLPKTKGTFGLDKTKFWPCNVGLSERGGGQ